MKFSQNENQSFISKRPRLKSLSENMAYALYYNKSRLLLLTDRQLPISSWVMTTQEACLPLYWLLTPKVCSPLY
jgi:hypothetical protein